MTAKEVEEVADEVAQACFQELVFNPRGWSTWFKWLPVEIRSGIRHFFDVREASFDLKKGTIVIVFEDYGKTYRVATDDVVDEMWVLRVFWEKNREGVWEVVYAEHLGDVKDRG